MSRTTSLAQSPLFRLHSETLPWLDRIKLSYDRAKAVVQIYDLTAEDILNVSERYWELHTDPILIMDGAVGTLLNIHYNLCIGTLAMFASGEPEISETLQKLLTFQLSGQFCLTELGHGLDAINLETTATLLSSGDFELNTPVERAAKYMPPTAPCGIPCVSVVFARLMVDGQDRGVKPFLVPLHDGNQMYSGVVCKILSPRGGSRPVNHALTYFHHVRLPKSALLGEVTKPLNYRVSFFYGISRVLCGTLSMGALGISAMRIACHVAGRYSLRRRVIDAATGVSRPIISFSTQYIPILTAISQTLVMQAFAQCSYARFVNTNTSSVMKHVVAAVFKSTVLKHTHNILLTLGDRCGAQGLFEINQLSVMHADMRGAAIAEGDTLVISIRFAIEILLGRIELPLPTNPEGLLAKHEQSLITELRKVLSSSTGHRAKTSESIILPHCQALLEAIGHRFAFEAAVEKRVDGPLVDLFVASVVDLDPAWYVENEGMSRWEQKTRLLRASTLLYPSLEDLLLRLNVKCYVTAPIVSDDRWDSYVNSLGTNGDTQVSSVASRRSSTRHCIDFQAGKPENVTKSRL